MIQSLTREEGLGALSSTSVTTLIVLSCSGAGCRILQIEVINDFINVIMCTSLIDAVRVITDEAVLGFIGHGNIDVIVGSKAFQSQACIRSVQVNGSIGADKPTLSVNTDSDTRLIEDNIFCERDILTINTDCVVILDVLKGLSQISVLVATPNGLAFCIKYGNILVPNIEVTYAIIADVCTRHIEFVMLSNVEVGHFPVIDQAKQIGIRGHLECKRVAIFIAQLIIVAINRQLVTANVDDTGVIDYSIGVQCNRNFSFHIGKICECFFNGLIGSEQGVAIAVGHNNRPYLPGVCTLGGTGCGDGLMCITVTEQCSTIHRLVISIQHSNNRGKQNTICNCDLAFAADLDQVSIADRQRGLSQCSDSSQIRQDDLGIQCNFPIDIYGIATVDIAFLQCISQRVIAANLRATGNSNIIDLARIDQIADINLIAVNNFMCDFDGIVAGINVKATRQHR